MSPYVIANDPFEQSSDCRTNDHFFCKNGPGWPFAWCRCECHRDQQA